MQKGHKQIVTIGELAKLSISLPGYQDVVKSLKTSLSTNKKCILALSGGPDSMLTACLVYNFFCSQKRDLHNLILVHCNHKVRQESDQEATFLRNFCKGANLVVVTRKGKLSKINEESLRKRRYAEFQKLIKKYHATRFITGHNLTDRIETTFLNLLRWAHLKWFLAMKEYEEHPMLKIHVYRPLLHLTKKHILNICSRLGIPFVVDPTNNDSTTSLRNKLRKEILPSLEKLSHKVSQNENSFQKSLENIYTALENQTEKRQFTLKPITRCELRKASSAYEILQANKERSNDMTAQILHALGIAKNISSNALSDLTKFFTTAEQWYKYFQWTYFFLAHGKKYAISAPISFREKVVEKSKAITTLWQVKRYNFNLPITKKEQLKSSLRFAKASDRYHGKTRNQYCITAKIPLFRRNFVPVLMKGEKIVQVFKELI